MPTQVLLVLIALSLLTLAALGALAAILFIRLQRIEAGIDRWKEVGRVAHEATLGAVEARGASAERERELLGVVKELSLRLGEIAQPKPQIPPGMRLIRQDELKRLLATAEGESDPAAKNFRGPLYPEGALSREPERENLSRGLASRLAGVPLQPRPVAVMPQHSAAPPEVS